MHHCAWSSYRIFFNQCGIDILIHPLIEGAFIMNIYLIIKLKSICELYFTSLTNDNFVKQSGNILFGFL